MNKKSKFLIVSSLLMMSFASCNEDSLNDDFDVAYWTKVSTNTLMESIQCLTIMDFREYEKHEQD